jgi:acetyl-CoA carboxylase carboxyltransferase component
MEYKIDETLDSFLDEHGNRIKWKLAYEEAQKQIDFVSKSMFNYMWKHGHIVNENREVKSLIKKQTKEMEQDKKTYDREVSRLKKEHTTTINRLIQDHEKEIHKYIKAVKKRDNIIKKLSKVKKFVRNKIAKLRKKFVRKRKIKDVK